MSRTVLLARTFLARFFESELLPPGLPQVQLVIWGLAVLAAPGLLMPMSFGNQYSMAQHDPEALAGLIRVHRLFFITWGMAGLGGIGLIVWENVFPDRRDARQLGILPIRNRTLIVARLLALSAIAGIFLVGVNAIPTLTYGPLAAAYGGSTNVIRGAAAHLLATASAGLFVFFLLIALQGTWLNVGGRRSAERFTLAVQLLFVVGLLQLVLSLPRLAAYLAADLQRVAADPGLGLVPSVWFLGLYEVLSGRPSAGSAALALRAVVATASVVAIAFVMMIATHGRLMRRALEGREPARRGVRLLHALVAPIVSLVCRTPVERAVFGFTLRTLARSRSHRLLLAVYLGVAFAIVAVTVTPLVVRRGLAGLDEPHVTLLAVPFVLVFFTLNGLRLLVGIPVDLKANWILRLLEPPDRVAVVNGVRSVMLVVGVVPATAVGGASAALLWGAWPGFLHTAVCGGMGWLLTELLLLKLRKIPFTCTYYPGRSRIQLWPFYFLAFTNYCFTTTAIERSIMHSPRAAAVFLIVVGTGIVSLARLRRRALIAPPGLLFEEEDPEALFEGFRLSEALAARHRAADRI